MYNEHQKNPEWALYVEEYGTCLSFGRNLSQVITQSEKLYQEVRVLIQEVCKTHV